MPGGKRQMMEIAKELQIPYETLTKMALAGSELDVKMQKIKFYLRCKEYHFFVQALISHHG